MLFIGFCVAQFTLIVTTPNSLTRWKTGEQVEISWIQVGLDGQIPIHLLDGSKSDTDPVKVITDDTDAASGSFSYTVENVERGNHYFLRMGKEGNYRYSMSFAIENGDAEVVQSRTEEDSRIEREEFDKEGGKYSPPYNQPQTYATSSGKRVELI